MPTLAVAIDARRAQEGARQFAQAAGSIRQAAQVAASSVAELTVQMAAQGDRTVDLNDVFRDSSHQVSALSARFSDLSGTGAGLAETFRSIIRRSPAVLFADLIARVAGFENLLSAISGGLDAVAGSIREALGLAVAEEVTNTAVSLAKLREELDKIRAGREEPVLVLGEARVPLGPFRRDAKLFEQALMIATQAQEAYAQQNEGWVAGLRRAWGELFKGMPSLGQMLRRELFGPVAGAPILQRILGERAVQRQAQDDLVRSITLLRLMSVAAEHARQDREAEEEATRGILPGTLRFHERVLELEKQRVARERGFPFPYLFDETQQVARAYGAACTPSIAARASARWSATCCASRTAPCRPPIRRPSSGSPRSNRSPTKWRSPTGCCACGARPSARWKRPTVSCGPICPGSTPALACLRQRRVWPTASQSPRDVWKGCCASSTNAPWPPTTLSASAGIPFSLFLRDGLATPMPV